MATFLASIRPRAHTIAEISAPHPTVSRDATTDLSNTYCRTVLAENAVLAVENASDQGWRGDAAYEAYRFDTYLGAKVVVDGRLYGTVCFVDGEPRSEPFNESDAAALALITRMIRQLLKGGQDEDRFRQTMARLKALFEGSPDMITIHDRKGNLIFPNPRLCDETGYTTEELTRIKVWDLDRDLDPEDAEALWTEMEPGDQRRLEGRYQRKDGSRFPVEVDIRCLDLEGDDRFVATARNITERKERETALQEERDLLDLVFRTSPTAITILDADGRFVKINDRAQQILGLEKDQVTDRTFNDPEWHITAPDGGPFPDDELLFMQVRDTGESVFGVEHAIEWPDGTRRLLSVSGAPLFGEDGSFDGAVFHLEDITERRQAKRDLQESEERFRGVFENAALGIALSTEDGEIIEANSALASMLEYDRESLRGVHFKEITHSEDLDADLHLFEELIAGKRNQYQLEKRYRRQSGEAFWGRLTVSRQNGADGPQIVGMIEDIDTERKRKRDLRLFRKMVEQAKDAIVLTEGEPLNAPGPEIVYANPAFTDMTGHAAEDVLGRPVDVLFGPDTRSRTIERLFRRLRNGEPAEVETVDYRRDGTPFVSRLNVAPVRNDANEITHLVSIERDVTEQRRMQERLLEIQEEERRRIDQEIHDEMGGLLTSLQLTLDLAQMEAEDGRNPTEQLETLEGLVDDLASTARSISRKLYPSTLPSRGLAEVLPELIRETEAQHTLDVTLEHDLKVDEHFSSLVERTVCWIVNEALANVGRHAETESARVRVVHSNQELRLAVVDEGEGFNPEVEDHEENLGIEGIRRRAERLDGTFELETTPGEGTRLTVELPLTIPSVPQ